jgi:hypothetical protein
VFFNSIQCKLRWHYIHPILHINIRQNVPTLRAVQLFLCLSLQFDLGWMMKFIKTFHSICNTACRRRIISITWIMTLQ